MMVPFWPLVTPATTCRQARSYTVSCDALCKTEWNLKPQEALRLFTASADCAWAASCTVTVCGESQGKGRRWDATESDNGLQRKADRRCSTRGAQSRASAPLRCRGGARLPRSIARSGRPWLRRRRAVRAERASHLAATPRSPPRPDSHVVNRNTHNSAMEFTARGAAATWGTAASQRKFATPSSRLPPRR